MRANNNHKSPGVDGIKPAFLKNEVCIRFIHKLCNYCFKTSEVPSAWLEAIIKPIPKGSKNSTIPSEYRGISLQSFVAKTYCRMLNARLVDYLETNKVLSDEQNGFRPNRCCQDHIFTLTSIIENRFLLKQDTFACFIDFRKAFDCVNRQMLWEKLESRYGISGALKALYSKVSCTVSINSELTNWFDVNSGVKQGCILSPTLFALFIDDLVDNLKSEHAGVTCGNTLISSLLYADDIVILAPNEGDLDKLIKVVESWCDRWSMNLNIAKTKVVHFRRKRGNKPKTSYTFTFNNDPIAISSKYKYLGLTLTEHLEWDAAFREICTNANRALALLNHRTRACGGLAESTYSLLFRQLVESIIMCNACIWGHLKNKNNLLNIQINALRFLLGVGKTCPKAGLFGETGWVPFQMTIKFSILRFRKRIATLDADRLTNKIFLWSESFSGTINNWTWKTKQMLESINDYGGLLSIDEMWNELAKCELKLWTDTVKEVPRDSETGGRFRFYREIKPAPSVEKYVQSSMSVNKKRFLTQLRCGCLPLEVELGRYRSPKLPLKDRICTVCSRETGDEIHFLTTCEQLKEQRTDLTVAMSNLFSNYISMDSGEKAKRIIEACAYDQDVSKATYRMFVHRNNLLT